MRKLYSRATQETVSHFIKIQSKKDDPKPPFDNQQPVTAGNLYLKSDGQIAEGQLDVAKQNLNRAVQQYTAKLAKDNKSTKIDFQPGQSMKDVLAVLAKEKATWEDAPRKCPMLSTLFHKLSDNTSRFTFVLDLLPDGDYTSSICGAIKLIVKAPANYYAIAEGLAQTLDDIDHIIPIAERENYQFPTKEGGKLVVRLLVLVFEFAEKAIKWYTRHKLGRIWTAVVGQEDAYNEEFGPLIKSIKDTTEFITTYARLEFYQNNKDYQAESRKTMDQILQLNLKTQKLVEDHLGQVTAKEDENRQRIDTLSDDVLRKSDMQNLLDGARLMMADFVRQIFVKEMLSYQCQLDEQSNIHLFELTMKRRKTITADEVSEEPANPSFNEIFENIQSFLPKGYDREADFQNVRNARRMVRMDQLLLPVVASSSEFANFLQPKSTTIWIQEEFVMERISPGTILSSDLIFSFIYSGTPTISFFSRLQAFRSPMASPLGCLKSLVFQLICIQNEQNPVMPCPVKEIDLINAAETIQDLWLCFETLMDNISELYLVLDGLDMYDNSNFRNDLSFLVENLANLTFKSAKNQTRIKIVFTSMGRSIVLEKELAEVEVLQLRSTNLRLMKDEYVDYTLPSAARMTVDDYQFFNN